MGTVVGEHGKEAEEVLHRVLWVGGLRREPYAIFGRRNVRLGAKSKTKQIGLRISCSLGSSPFGFLIDHGDCTRNAAWKYVSES